MKKYFFFFLLPFLFTSCFEVKEEVNMKKDGSGDVNLMVDLSQSKDQVKSYLQAEESNGVLQDKNVESIFKHIKVVLEGVKGISNVTINSDYVDYIFSVDADFTDVEALNEAITTVSKNLDYLYVPPIAGKSFSGSSNSFNRLFDYPIDPKDFGELPGFVQYTLSTAKVISVYRFEQEIRNFSNKKAALSSSKKAIRLEETVANIGKGQGTLENKITF